jgi:hypothetical protein
MKRIYVNISNEAADALKIRAEETGVIVAEQIRRAINMTLYAEHLQKKPTHCQSAQPVLFAGREEQ